MYYLMDNWNIEARDKDDVVTYHEKVLLKVVEFFIKPGFHIVVSVVSVERKKFIGQI